MKSKLYLLLFVLPLLVFVLGCEKRENAPNIVKQETGEEEEVMQTSPDKMIALGKSFRCTFYMKWKKG